MSIHQETEQLSEEKLFEEYLHTKDRFLRDQIVSKYLYMAEILAKKFLNRGVEYDDLYQIACLGLLNAVERFDISKEVKFSSFATPTIIGEIKRYFRDKGNTIRVPRRIYEAYQKVNHARATLSQSLGRAPKVEEISQHLNMPEEMILEVLESTNVTNIQSLEQSAYLEDETTLYDLVGKEDTTFQDIENRDFIERSLNSFNIAEQEFIKQRYYQQKTQKQIANILGVSQMYVSRLEKKILERLKRLYYKSVN